MENETPKGIKTPLPKDFDTTAELWDRVVDDLANGGAVCVETITQLKEEAESADE